jgi:hypothetical protein
MCPDIEIDAEVWSALKERAEPFTDTPNSVIRRLLGLDAATAEQSAEHRPNRSRSEPSKSAVRSRRAPSGSLLPETEYETPILRALESQGGRAPAREVVAAVGQAIEDKLTDLDRDDLPNGGKRWENRVQFTRLRLKERGLIKSGSPRGIWEISDQGRETLNPTGANDGK